MNKIVLKEALVRFQVTVRLKAFPFHSIFKRSFEIGAMMNDFPIPILTSLI